MSERSRFLIQVVRHIFNPINYQEADVSWAIELGMKCFAHHMKKISLVLFSFNAKRPTRLQYYFKVDSLYLAHIRGTFRNIYGINDFLRNDPDALLSRISFVQRTEPRSSYVFLNS